MEIKITIDKMNGQHHIQNYGVTVSSKRIEDCIERIERDYNITPINLERYRNIRDAMKRIPPSYFSVFQALSEIGVLSELLIKRNIIGNEKLVEHIIKVSKDKDHYINIEDVKRCCQMYDIELEMFLDPNTRITDLISIINSFNDSYSKTSWHVNSRTIESMCFYFGC